MASSLSLHQHTIYSLSPTPTLGFGKYPHHISILPSFRKNFLKFDSPTTVPFAVTESDSPKSLEPDPQTLLQQVAESFVLPADFFSQLPRDLRLDLNDAAFDLSNGPVKDEIRRCDCCSCSSPQILQVANPRDLRNLRESRCCCSGTTYATAVQCGEEVGETLLNISRAWEMADTSTSTALVDELPLLIGSLTGSQKSAFGRRLLSAGKRFQSMGQYGEGEVQKIAKVMIKTGKLLSASPASGVEGEEFKQQTRMFKFGDLQVELTSGKAYTGAAIAVIFSFLSWQLSQGIQSIPESSLQYANDNALLLAKSLRASLLVMSYSSTVLAAFATVGLILLGGQLKSENK